MNFPNLLVIKNNLLDVSPSVRLVEVSLRFNEAEKKYFAAFNICHKHPDLKSKLINTQYGNKPTLYIDLLVNAKQVPEQEQQALLLLETKKQAVQKQCMEFFNLEPSDQAQWIDEETLFKGFFEQKKINMAVIEQVVSLYTTECFTVKETWIVNAKASLQDLMHKTVFDTKSMLLLDSQVSEKLYGIFEKEILGGKSLTGLQANDALSDSKILSYCSVDLDANWLKSEQAVSLIKNVLWERFFENVELISDYVKEEVETLIDSHGEEEYHVSFLPKEAEHYQRVELEKDALVVIDNIGSTPFAIKLP